MLRRLEKKDVNIIYKQLNALSKQDKEFFHPYTFDKKTILGLLVKKHDCYFVFEDKDKIVGHSFLRTFGKYEIPTFGEVVWQEYRDMGFGFKILQQTLDRAKDIGFVSVKLKVYKNNVKAFSLYKKVGFKEIGEEDNQIWMEKGLNRQS